MLMRTTVYYRKELPRYSKVLGFGKEALPELFELICLAVGLIGGGIYGVLQSTEYTLRR